MSNPDRSQDISQLRLREQARRREAQRVDRRKREFEARERLERELYAEIRRRLIPTGELVRA